MDTDGIDTRVAIRPSSALDMIRKPKARLSSTGQTG
jgi:hypothetical protein